MGKKNKGDDGHRWVFDVIALGVLLIWIVSNFVDWFYTEYTVPFEVHGLMGSIIGYWAGSKIFDVLRIEISKKNSNSGDK